MVGGGDLKVKFVRIRFGGGTMILKTQVGGK